MNKYVYVVDYSIGKIYIKNDHNENLVIEDMLVFLNDLPRRRQNTKWTFAIPKN